MRNRNKSRRKQPTAEQQQETSATADETAEGGPAAVPPPARLPLRVVGIGASAGGLEAFRELLQNLKVDSE